MRFDRAQIFQAAGGKIVNDNDAFAIGQQTLDEMRADETRAAGDETCARMEGGEWRMAFAILPQRVCDGFASFCRNSGVSISLASWGLDR